jgi:hypothetical protein
METTEDLEFVDAVLRDLGRIRSQAHGERYYLPDLGIDLSDMLSVLTAYSFSSRGMAYDSVGPRRARPSKAKLFVYNFFAEIQDIICNSRRRSEAGKLARGKIAPVASALSAYLATRLKIDEPLAVGAATYILVIIGEAARDAFCKMTRDEWSKHIKG